MEFENTLAATDPSAARPDDLLAIERRQRLSPKTAARVRLDAFAKAYTAIVADNVISDAEADYLTALRRLLHIRSDDIDALDQRLVHPRYAKAVADVLADGSVSDEERARLQRLAETLRLPPALKDEIYNRAAQALLNAKLKERAGDRRLSPDELRTFDLLARNLGVNPTFDTATRSLMDRYALFWRIENGDPPAIDAPIQLQRGEVCYFTCPAKWLEYRKQTTTVGYSGAGVSIRIVRGVYYHVGASRPHRITTEGLAVIETGSVYLTNKRILFTGQVRNFAIRLSAVLAFDVFADGMVLEKATGKHPHLLLDGDVELASVVLGSVLGQSS